MFSLLVVLSVFSLGSAQTYPSGVNGSVYLTGSTWSFTPGVIDKVTSVAWGTFEDMTTTVSGFGSLTIVTNAKYTDAEQSYGAGFAEGAITQARIKEQYDNMENWLQSNFNNKPPPPIYQEFFNTQDAWARAQIAGNNSALWTAFSTILGQFDGLVAGYAAVAPPSDALDKWAFQQLNAMGDFLDLIPALQGESEAAKPWRWQEWGSPEAVMRHVHKTTHCSGLIKTDGNFSDIWFGHSAWFVYQGTSRIYKHYQLNYAQPEVVGHQLSFSSYPGYLSSLDDFYQIWDSGLVVIETTNSIFNTSLYKLVKPQSLFAWQRVRLANLVSSGGEEWGAVLDSYNSGTYNNAYTVLKLSDWAPGQALTPGMLYIAEQIPGLVVWGDVTQELERGYFPMYNVPYWPEIYAASGYAEVIAHFKDQPNASALAGIDYQLAPRATIFRRDQGKVVDFASFAAIMRYNDYENDPYANGDPWNAICSRGDLASSPGPDGCYDTKASAATLWPSYESIAINGPTTNGGLLPPFAWSQFPSTMHEGLPEVYNFSFGTQKPGWL